MIQGIQGAGRAENPLTMRDLTSTSEELVPPVSAGTAFADAYLTNITRGQTGVDARHSSPNRLGQTVNDLYLQREAIWCERWAQWLAGRRS